jgi:hypothetical protein
VLVEDERLKAISSKLCCTSKVRKYWNYFCPYTGSSKLTENAVPRNSFTSATHRAKQPSSRHYCLLKRRRYEYALIGKDYLDTRTELWTFVSPTALPERLSWRSIENGQRTPWGIMGWCRLLCSGCISILGMQGCKETAGFVLNGPSIGCDAK